jgi:fructuronate reductase
VNNPLTRAALAAQSGAVADAAPVRIVHLGLGAFHRAHQAWYTDAVDDANEWGIASFTGRNPQAAVDLASQDGLYTLLERSTDGDQVSVIRSISRAVDGARLDEMVGVLAEPTTALVTLTITEAGYRLTSDGLPNDDDALVRSDLEWCQRHFGDPEADLSNGPATTLVRLLLGLESRRRRGGAPIAIVPCDNMPDNGAFMRRGMLALAERISDELALFVAEHVSFVSTSVDRITPKTTPDDVVTAAAASGWDDGYPVVTEPFRDWVLSGVFPLGRPEWERAGARFVDDIEPFERRKLWLLNGAHSLLAYAGAARGHETVAQAIVDPVARQWVEEFWDEAVRHLPAEGLQLDQYRADLIARFENSAIQHRLAQIGLDGVTKLRVRVAPVLLAERAAGRDGIASARALAAWVAAVRHDRLPGDRADDLIRAADSSSTAALLSVVDSRLGEDPAIVATVEAQLSTIGVG